MFSFLIIPDNGSIEGEIISLGNFTSDYNWLKANESNFPISSGILFHEQYYELGTICELTGNPRRVIAKVIKQLLIQCFFSLSLIFLFVVTVALQRYSVTISKQLKST